MKSFKAHIIESAEEVNELSKKTLGSYVKKAQPSMDKHADTYHKERNRLEKKHKSDFADDTPKSAKAGRKMMNRDDGIDRAKKKLGEARKRAPKLKPDSIKTIRAQDKKNMPHGWDTKRTADKPKKLTSTQKSMADIRARARARGLPEDTQLDELSKKTLGSYVKKASDNMHHQGEAGMRADAKAMKARGSRLDTVGRKASIDKYEKRASTADKKAEKRQTGISRAVNRLTK